MSAVVADTHALIWHLLRSAPLSPRAARAFEAARRSGQGIIVSPVSVVEIVYLAEKGRVAATAPDRVLGALRDPESDLLAAPLSLDVAAALADIPRHIVPDMPDRIIAATALHLGLPLVTRDRQIRALDIETIW